MSGGFGELLFFGGGDEGLFFLVLLVFLLGRFSYESGGGGFLFFLGGGGGGFLGGEGFALIDGFDDGLLSFDADGFVGHFLFVVACAGDVHGGAILADGTTGDGGIAIFANEGAILIQFLTLGERLGMGGGYAHAAAVLGFGVAGGVEVVGARVALGG